MLIFGPWHFECYIFLICLLFLLLLFRLFAFSFIKILIGRKMGLRIHRQVIFKKACKIIGLHCESIVQGLRLSAIKTEKTRQDLATI